MTEEQDDEIYVALDPQILSSGFCDSTEWEVVVLGDGKSFLIYLLFMGENHNEIEIVYYEDLMDHSLTAGIHHWVLLGDFNVTLFDNKSTNTSVRGAYGVKYFKGCVEALEIKDILMSGFFSMGRWDTKGRTNGLFLVVGVGDHYILAKRLKMMKKHMRKLNKKNDNVFANVKKLKIEMERVQADLDKNRYCSVLREEEMIYINAYRNALLDEERVLRQKSKIKWLKERDLNNAYFHNSLKGRMNKSIIESISGEGRESFTGVDVADKFINEHDALEMVKLVTNEEIKAAIFDIKDNKAPGPDGFTSKNFKASWGVVEGDVCRAVNEFFSSGKMLGELNTIIISLVPKSKNPRKTSDYRPIACCEVIYKCISKVITNRIKKVLKELVDPNQSAFIKGRQICDNILLIQELMNGYTWKNKIRRCAFKVDIQKAYDTVSWDFLKMVVDYFGFHSKMVNWIMVCLSTTSFSINVNGNSHGFFKAKRGLRQDDLMLLCHADKYSASILRRALDEFSLTSGLYPSMSKSIVYFRNVPNDIKCSILMFIPARVNEASGERNFRLFRKCDRSNDKLLSIVTESVRLKIMSLNILKAFPNVKEVADIWKFPLKKCPRIGEEILVLVSFAILSFIPCTLFLAKVFPFGFYFARFLMRRVLGLHYSYVLISCCLGPSYGDVSVYLDWSLHAFDLFRVCRSFSVVRMTKVIKREFKKIKDVKVEDVSLTCNTSLEVFNNEVNRLSGMDDDLFTYEVEVANIPCDSKMDDDSEHEANDDIGYDPSDIRGDDEVELTDEESSDDKDEVAETYLLRTLRDSRPFKITRMIGSMNGTRTYHGWMDDGYCNGGNLPRTYIIGNQLHYQDYEWYEGLEDSELKDKALRNKAIMEGFIKEDDDESRYEQMRCWNINANYDDAYETNHEDNKSEELCEVHELPMCNIRRYMMIKYSFNNDEKYVDVKEDEYDDLTITREKSFG
ncbi:RNA-directed DNA polymerase, eukaryota, reverse transcriptase zinc-binding domain protein [Tanacetum coccineum]